VKFFQDFLGRAPFVFLGVMGIFSIVGNFMILEENIHHTLDAWRVFTRLIWDFLLGWLFEWIGWELPWWVKDYLTFGLIVKAADFRAGKLFQIQGLPGNNMPFSFRLAVFDVLIWPMVVKIHFMSDKELEHDFQRMMRKKTYKHSGRIYSSELERFKESIKNRRRIFTETFVYALIAIAINYAFVFSGAPSVDPIIQIWV